MSTIYHRSFGQLLSDSIFFERMARKENDAAIQRKYARSSIILSVLTLESAANCCMNQLEANKQLVSDIDKLPFLSKFDLFALHGFNKSIDYGRNEIQRVKEFKSIRDKLVHPKVSSSELGNIKESHRCFYAGSAVGSFSIAPRKETRLIDKYSLIGHSDCFIGIKAVVDYYNYFFSELLNMEKGLVFGLLNDSIIQGEELVTAYPPELFNEMDYISSHGVEFEFWLNKPRGSRDKPT